MSGVSVTQGDDIVRVVENPEAENQGVAGRRKVLVHVPSGETITSCDALEEKLFALGWERYYDGDPDLLQFHKKNAIDLIALPKNFSKFNSVHMYDVVIKNRSEFEVRNV